MSDLWVVIRSGNSRPQIHTLFNSVFLMDIRLEIHPEIHLASPGTHLEVCLGVCLGIRLGAIGFLRISWISESSPCQVYGHRTLRETLFAFVQMQKQLDTSCLHKVLGDDIIFPYQQLTLMDPPWPKCEASHLVRQPDSWAGSKLRDFATSLCLHVLCHFQLPLSSMVF